MTKTVPQSARGEAGSASKRVLVIDDNRDCADSIRMLLESEGYETEYAYDGKAGLALARTFKPEVVLLDIGLPGMSGFDVARKLKRLQQGRPFKLVAITGYAYLEKQITEAGFDGYRLKPVAFEALREFL